MQNLLNILINIIKKESDFSTSSNSLILRSSSLLSGYSILLLSGEIILDVFNSTPKNYNYNNKFLLHHYFLNYKS